MSFHWFFFLICVSLRGLRLFSRMAWLGTGQFRWSIGTNGSIGLHPHTSREPKAVFDSGLYAMDSGFKVSLSCIPDPKAQDSGSKNFPDSVIWIPLRGESFSRMVSRRAFIYVESVFWRVYDRILFYFISNSPLPKIEGGSI